MKKVLLLFIVIFSVNYSADAQWYYSTCGVTDINDCTPEEFECLWNTTERNVKTGRLLTVVGSSAIIAGTAVIIVGVYGQSWGGIIFGTVTAMGGIITDLVGIPIWVAGGNRKDQLIKTPNYKALNFGTLNISPTINRNHFNNTYSFGITASLSF